jgi:uncharacterized protein (DUF1778 family)
MHACYRARYRACYRACMGQMTWRAPDELLERVRHAAGVQGRSLNDYVSAVLNAATDPALADSEFAGLRQRLAQADLLVRSRPHHRRPSSTAVAAARRHAGQGTPLEQLVTDNRH